MEPVPQPPPPHQTPRPPDLARGRELALKAAVAWLQPSEIHEILTSFAEHGPPVTGAGRQPFEPARTTSSLGWKFAEAVPFSPQSGQVFVYDKVWMGRQSSKFKNDGHSWKCRSGETRPREDTVSLQLNGKPNVLKGAYAHHNFYKTFHRRTYHLNLGNDHDRLHLVQYLDTEQDLNKRGDLLTDAIRRLLGDEVHLSRISTPLTAARQLNLPALARPVPPPTAGPQTLSYLQHPPPPPLPHASAAGSATLTATLPASSAVGEADKLGAMWEAVLAGTDEGENPPPSNQPAFEVVGPPVPTNSAYPASPDASSFEGLPEQELLQLLDFGSNDADPTGETMTDVQPAPHPPPLPPPQPERLPTIADFSPEWAQCPGGTKVVIVVAGSLPPPTSPAARLQCGFDGVWVDAVRLGPAALKCISPAHAAGACRVTVAEVDDRGGTRHPLTPPSDSLFSFRELWKGGKQSVAMEAASTPQRNMLFSKRDHEGTTLPPHADTISGQTNRPNSTLPQPHLPDEVHREYKIRIVEKLDKLGTTIRGSSRGGPGNAASAASAMDTDEPPSVAASTSSSAAAAPTVASTALWPAAPATTTATALPASAVPLAVPLASRQAPSPPSAVDTPLHPSPLPPPLPSHFQSLAVPPPNDHSSPGLSPDADFGDPLESADKLLDDAELTKLEDTELEDVLERLLVRVVEDLVKVAGNDSGLQEELNAPDRNGYCLLHYACMYNLAALVPVLLEYRADTNAVTLDGQTPLHLTAAAGYAELAPALVNQGADVHVADKAGLTAWHHAVANQHHALACWLRAQMSPEFVPDDGGARSVLPQSPAWDGTTAPDGSPLLRWSSSDRLLGSADGELLLGPSTPSLVSERSVVGMTVDEVGGLSPDHSNPNVNPSELSQQNVQLLQDAFCSLSLKDKCLLSKCVALQRSGSDAHLRPERVDDDLLDPASEVASVITESDKESLDVAMSMMAPDEIFDMEKEARVLQKNMKAWMMRRNYMSMRGSVRKLQLLWRETRRSRADEEEDRKVNLSTGNAGNSDRASSGAVLGEGVMQSVGTPGPPSCGGGSSGGLPRESKEDEARRKLQAVSRGMLARKHFRRIKQQTLALIVIQRTLLRRRRVAMDSSALGGSHRTLHSPSQHRSPLQRAGSLGSPGPFDLGARPLPEVPLDGARHVPFASMTAFGV